MRGDTHMAIQRQKRAWRWTEASRALQGSLVTSPTVQRGTQHCRSTEVNTRELRACRNTRSTSYAGRDRAFAALKHRGTSFEPGHRYDPGGQLQGQLISPGPGTRRERAVSAVKSSQPNEAAALPPPTAVQYQRRQGQGYRPNEAANCTHYQKGHHIT